jgi:hypothetical protein
VLFGTIQISVQKASGHLKAERSAEQPIIDLGGVTLGAGRGKPPAYTKNIPKVPEFYSINPGKVADRVHHK